MVADMCRYRTGAVVRTVQHRFRIWWCEDKSRKRIKWLLTCVDIGLGLLSEQSNTDLGFGGVRIKVGGELSDCWHVDIGLGLLSEQSNTNVGFGDVWMNM